MLESVGRGRKLDECHWTALQSGEANAWQVTAGSRGWRFAGPLLCRTRTVASALLALLLSLAYAQSPLELQQDAAQWALPGKDYAGTRYSPLARIDTTNVADLEVAWTFATGVLRGHEGQPLVVGERMFFITPYPHTVFAIDLGDPGTPAWTYRPETDDRAIGSACCDVVNRGVFYADGRLFFVTLDGQLYALDADSGEALWAVKNADPYQGETMTNHPLVAGDKVIVGISGGEYGARGHVTAYDVETGERVWRYYTTGPDEEVGIGPRFQPFYEQNLGEDLGMTTWPGDEWRVGGSTTWGWFTYDPELNLVYYGTGNPGVWNPSLRRGNPERLEDQVRWANKWGASIMARDVDTGELIWAYQLVPHDEWDYDEINENILIDIEIDGEVRKALGHFGKNGFGYLIDRVTGEVLRADPFTDVNWAERIDLETGLPVRNPSKGTQHGVMTEDICPSTAGGKDQQPAAWSPDTGLFYLPFSNLCMDYMGTEISYTAGVPYVGAQTSAYVGPAGHMGELAAWDPVEGEKVWHIEERFSVWSGVMATGGDLVFYGTLDGAFKAADARSGEVLWQFQTGSGIIGNPITYLGPDGRQYVAILSGVGGVPGTAVITGTEAEHAGGAFGDLARYTNLGGMLYVFALPDGEGSSDSGMDGDDTGGADTAGGDTPDDESVAEDDTADGDTADER